jgi:hypothetical protein
MDWGSMGSAIRLLLTEVMKSGGLYVNGVGLL